MPFLPFHILVTLSLDCGATLCMTHIHIYELCQSESPNTEKPEQHPPRTGNYLRLRAPNSQHLCRHLVNDRPAVIIQIT